MEKTPYLKITICCLSIALGVLLGLAPLESSLAGLLTPLGLIYLARICTRLSWQKTLAISTLASLCVTFIAFNWLLVGIRNLSGSSSFVAFLFLLPYSIFLQAKLPFFLLTARYFLRRYPGQEIWLLAALALLSDLCFYQMFPWYYGNLFTGNTFLLQFAAIAGIYGMGFVQFLVAHLVVVLFTFLSSKRKDAVPNKTVATSRLLDIVFPLLVVILVYLYGLWHLVSFRPGSDLVHVAMLQPNTGLSLQEKKEDEAFAATSLSRVASLALKAIYEANGQVDLLVLPESAIPFFSSNPSPANIQNKVYSSTFQGLLAFVSREGKLDIVYNEMDWEKKSVSNRASVFSRFGERSGSYQKQILVPFGEYLPFAFSWLGALFPESSKYVPGENYQALNYSYIPQRPPLPLRKIVQNQQQDDLQEIQQPEKILQNWPEAPASQEGKFTPLLCYEAMFPEYVRESVNKDAGDFLINLTNDSWFGNYLENYQHSSAAKVRAVETGRYLIRSTLSGISSVVSPTGEDSIAKTAINEMAIRTFSVPRRSGATTIYLRYGNTSNYALLGLGFLLYFLGFWRNSRSSNTPTKPEK
ncbi:MAG: nitrilase-related carbon-nitrogen hydrolase [Spirochaetota bacterium]